MISDTDYESVAPLIFSHKIKDDPMVKRILAITVLTAVASSLGCKTMREGVLASSVFFVAGVLMILAGTRIVPEVFYMQHIGR